MVVKELEPQEENLNFMHYFSMFIGYTYAACWGISFLGQVKLNYNLKNVEGCNLDFVIYNISGFAFYTGYNLAGYLYPHKSGIHAEGNDLAFALWSFAMTIIIGVQCFVLYPRGANKVSPLCKVVTYIQWGIVVGHYLCYGILGIYDISNVYENIWYVMSYLKLFITVTKYIPQAWWNYVRKSTKGWSACGVILDFWGGILCAFQIVMEYYNGEKEGDDQGFNVAKFGLAGISIAFDIFFQLQHFVFYRKNNLMDEKQAQLNNEQNIQQQQQGEESQQQQSDQIDSAKDVQIYVHNNQNNNQNNPEVSNEMVSSASTAPSVKQLNKKSKKNKNYQQFNDEQQEDQQAGQVEQQEQQ